MEMRLQKILAQVGLCSRRRAEELIAQGRVTVNGVPAQPGTKADPERDHIKVDGKLLPLGPAPKVYYAFYKPREVLSSLYDPQGRPTVRDFLPRRLRLRLWPVGRLDYHSEGLLLLTNDGQLTHAVLHPSRGVEKTYQVKVKGLVEPKTLQRLQRGLRLPDGPARAVRARLLRAAEANCWVELTVLEGRKHLVRRMLQALGHPVLRLRRVRIDGVGLGGLAPGGLRPLTEKELQSLRRHSGLLREAV